MASQSLNHSDEAVPAVDAAVEEPNHGPHPDHQVDLGDREVNVDQLSESDFAGMNDSGLEYGDHDYIGSNPNVKCPPETAQFPVLGGVTDQYLNGETTDPCAERTDNRLVTATTPLTASGSALRKQQVSGATVFRPAKGEDFAHTNALPGPGKSVSWKHVPNTPNVTQPKKSGRPPKNEAGGDRLMGRAMVKAGMQTQHGQMQPHVLPLQGMHTMHDLGLTVRGAAPIVTPARGQKITPRGRTVAARRDIADDVSGGYPMMPAQQATPTYRPTSPKKVTQFRSAQAAEEAHTREMMEAAQNALAPTNATLSGHNVMTTVHSQHHHSIVLPVQHEQQLQQPHMDDRELPRTPGKSFPRMSPVGVTALSRRTASESQEMNVHLLQETLPTNPDGLPVTPGGGRKTPVRSRTPRSRMSISESTGSASGSQAPSPQRQFVVSPPRSHVVLQPRALHLSPQRQMLSGGHLKAQAGPSTMASAQLQMSSNAPMPSLHNQSYQQLPIGQRQVGPSPPGRIYYDVHGVQAAPLITASGSNTYTPRRRKEKEPDEAVEAEVSRNVKNILLADKTQRLSTTSSHTLSPRDETSDDDDIGRDRQMVQIAHENKRSATKRTPQKTAKRGGKQEESEEEGEVDWVITCICGQTEDDGEEMIMCDRCKIRWEHTECIFPVEKKAPVGNYTCHVCQPRPTILTRDQARAYQDRVKMEKTKMREADVKRKLQERAKRKEENSRKSNSSAIRSTHSKGAAPKHDKPGTSNFKEIDVNEFSPNARRFLAISRPKGNADTEILKMVRDNQRARSLVVEKNHVSGVVAMKEIEDGSYIAELCGYVSLQKEHPHVVPGSSTEHVFFFERDGETLLIDTRKMGNFARNVRRSCKPNSELQEIMSGSEFHIMIKASREIKAMEEVLIGLDGDWKRQTRPVCACKDTNSCLVAVFFNQHKHGVSVVSRRSLPTNGTTPKGALSPIRRAVTEKKKTVSSKKVISKKGRKKGTIKLPRPTRKSTGGSASTVDGSEGEEDTEKEYEESTADEKEKEEEKEKEKEMKEEKTRKRGRRNTGSTSEGKEKKEEEESHLDMPILTPTRSSTRIRNDSDVKKEMEDQVEKNKNVEQSQNETGGAKKSARRSGLEKEKETEKEIKEEIKEEPKSPSTKKTKKPWPTMNYSLPSERNKPSREERKMQALVERVAKIEKKSRGSSTRGRTSTPIVVPPTTPAAPPKEEKTLSSSRGKRKTETSDEAARLDSATAAASTALVPPPRKRWTDTKKTEEKDTHSSAPSSLSSMTWMKDDNATTTTPVLTGGKKKSMKKHEQEQKEMEKEREREKAADTATVSTTWTPTRSTRRKEERGAVEALLHMGTVDEKKEKNKGKEKEKESNRTEMRRHAIQLRDKLRPTPFSVGGITVEGYSTPSSSMAGPSVPLPVPVPVPVATPIEKAVKKTSISLGEYKKRRQTGGSASGIEKKEERERKEEPPKKSFMPSVEASTSVPTSLPNVKLPGLEDAVGLEELSRRVYGETLSKEVKSPSVAGKTESTPKRQSINDRLKNEFSLPIRSVSLTVATSTTPTAAASAATAAVTSSISPIPTGGQLTPTGARTSKNRLSDARAMNVDPPGLIDCPRPTSIVPSTPSSSSATPSTSNSSFFHRAASVRSTK